MPLPDQVLVGSTMMEVMVGKVLVEVTQEVVSALTARLAVKRKGMRDLKVCIVEVSDEASDRMCERVKVVK